MDRITNPYTPGAGLRPHILAGRDEIIETAAVLIGQVKIKRSPRPLMLYGLRGVGKTVLLNEFAKMAKEAGLQVEQIEIVEKDDFKRVMARRIRKILLEISTLEKGKDLVRRALRVLKSFSFKLPEGAEMSVDLEVLLGQADSGDFQSDLIDLMVNLGYAAESAERPICFLIDEVQNLKEPELEALLAAMHRIGQLNLPILSICAGLPQITALAGNAKSYAERLFEYEPIGRLPEAAARNAIIQPARQVNVEYEAEAVAEILRLSEGYPYFIQEFGKFIWFEAARSPIRLVDVKNAEQNALRSLDNSFFKTRLDRATESEKAMMRCMAQVGKGPYLIHKVAECLGKSLNSLSPTRSSLIKKGFIFSHQHGQVEFTVPKFREFLMRYYEMDLPVID